MKRFRSRLLPLFVLLWLTLIPRLSWALGLGDVSDWAQSTWNAAVTTTKTGQDDLYFSGYTWHDPGTYTEAKRAVLNKHAWGIGWGRHLTNADGNEDMVYAMVFSDSHWNAEPIVGYAHQWMYFNDSPVGFGLGYTLAVTSRADIFKNIPFPIALPIASLRFGKLSIYGTFIPKVNNKLNNGNVAFFFGRYEF
ncbi:MAG: peptide ABC transporter permease [Thiomonas sp.]|nr:peptide ABC transporter permease [Thiomonas sp.]